MADGLENGEGAVATILDKLELAAVDVQRGQVGSAQHLGRDLNGEAPVHVVGEYQTIGDVLGTVEHGCAGSLGIALIHHIDVVGNNQVLEVTHLDVKVLGLSHRVDGQDANQ